MKASCYYCGKTIRKQPATLKHYKHVFCDRECYWKYRKEMWVYPKSEKIQKHSFLHRLKTKILSSKGE